MEQGGNAIDAAAAMCFCLNLLEPQSNGLAGEVPTLIYSARERRAYALSGMGWSAKAFTIDWCREHGIDLIPGDGYLPACVPAVIGTWAAALARFGTLSFSDVVAARHRAGRARLSRLPGPARRAGRQRGQIHRALPQHRRGLLAVGPGARGRLELLRNPAWAETLRILCRAEAVGCRTRPRGRHRGRARRLLQGRDRRAHHRLHHGQPGRRRQRIDARRPADP